jgi:hypothetical protein
VDADPRARAAVLSARKREDCVNIILICELTCEPDSYNIEAVEGGVAVVEVSAVSLISSSYSEAVGEWSI